ncbi:MAG: SDR family oxidoreductase [bacterium]|nr:SDR family oxidoreductase [bacterium]
MNSNASRPSNLQDQVLIVTGGTGALGSAVSASLLDAGARVIVTYIVDEEYAELAASIAETRDAQTAGRLSGRKVDVTDESAVNEFFQTTASEHSRLDGLVHIAGGFVYAGLVETSTEQFDRMWNLNLRSLFLCGRAAYPLLKQSRGAIITIGARPGLQGTAGLSAYAASKAGVINFTQTVADEGRADGVRAFSVLPSIIDTPANRAAMPDADFNSWVTPASLARVIRFALEEESRDMSGAVLPVYGGA